MEIQSVNALRPILFEALEYKAAQLYHATRSRKYADEVREYIFVVLALTKEYLSLHTHDFRLRKNGSPYSSPQISNSPIAYMDGWCEPKNFKSMLESEDLRVQDIHSIRRWVWLVFDKILELHCFLEGLDYQIEHDSRYVYVRGQAVIRPGSPLTLNVGRRRMQSGGGRFSRGTSSFGSILENWSGEFRARKTYECMNCPEWIYPGQYYKKELIRLGETLMVMRYHSSCPDDPNDPRGRKEDDLEDQLAGAQEMRRVA